MAIFDFVTIKITIIFLFKKWKKLGKKDLAIFLELDILRMSIFDMFDKGYKKEWKISFKSVITINQAKNYCLKIVIF